MKNFQSCAEWDKHTQGFHSNNITKDQHETKEQAEGVCKLLRKEGLGGEGIWFPVKTWVEERKEIPMPDGFGMAWVEL